MNILSQKRQVNEMADGMRPELFYGFIRELAAGCYRADKQFFPIESCKQR